MLTVTILKGLPASGKTMWAKDQIAKAPTNSLKRINKDDMRAMLDNGKYSKGNEKLVLALRDTLIGLAVAQGSHVIVDDTNLAPWHEDDIRLLVKSHADISGKEYRVVVKEFDTSIGECIVRDSKRKKPVGEKAIRQMYNRFIKVVEYDIPKYREHTKIESCIVCDIDGTLARMDTRGPFEFEKMGEDGVHAHVADILEKYADATEVIILLSGRGEEWRGLTEEWLQINSIAYDYLFMRPEKDNRCDTVIKRELFETHIEPHYDVMFIIDDRDRVVDMWRKDLNIPCLQAYLPLR